MVEVELYKALHDTNLKKRVTFYLHGLLLTSKLDYAVLERKCWTEEHRHWICTKMEAQ